LSLVAPEKVRYQTKLEGYDPDWEDAGNQRIAYYHELPPGAYVFRVRAANNDGVWNEAGASLAFVMEPFVWQTIWFRGGLAALLVGCGGFLVWWWTRLRLRHALEREGSAREIRDLAGRLINAQEDERIRLARELHDDLSQSLALMSVELEMFGQQPPTAPDAIHRRMQEFSGRMKTISSDVHRLSHELHPAKLEQLGLAAAVRGLCKEMALAHLLAIHFQAEELPRTLPRAIALCLYRVTQETLHNVVKHSHATRASVELSARDNGIGLRIEDDGEGFNPAAASGKGSLGLVSMRERVRNVGGRLSVDSSAGRGTRVEVRLALPEKT
jgi:signal transduction histidine kinase